MPVITNKYFVPAVVAMGFLVVSYWIIARNRKDFVKQENKQRSTLGDVVGAPFRKKGLKPKQGAAGIAGGVGGKGAAQ